MVDSSLSWVRHPVYNATLGADIAMVGDGEYIIYTALAWRNKAFGQGSSFAWADDSNTYAVLEGKLKVRVWRNFKVRVRSILNQSINQSLLTIPFRKRKRRSKASVVGQSNHCTVGHYFPLVVMGSSSSGIGKLEKL